MKTPQAHLVPVALNHNLTSSGSTLSHCSRAMDQVPNPCQHAAQADEALNISNGRTVSARNDGAIDKKQRIVKREPCRFHTGCVVCCLCVNVVSSGTMKHQIEMSVEGHNARPVHCDSTGRGSGLFH